MKGSPALGRLLVASGLVTQQALDEIVLLQRTDSRRLGELLEEKGLLRPNQLAQFLSHQLACPWVSLQRVEIAREAVSKLPREIALKHHMVPVHLRSSKEGKALYVAMDDPTDDVALSEATHAATMPVKPMVAITSEIRTLLEHLYGNGTSGSVRPGEPSSASTPAPPPAAPAAPAPSPPPPPVQPVAGSPRPANPTASMRPPKPPPPTKSIVPPTKPNVAVKPATYAKGTILDDRYELVRDLGGRVAGSRWEARHLRTTRRVVLKVGVRATDEIDVEAVRRERVALGRLQHSGAVDLRDAGETSVGDPFIVLEMLEGRSLEGLVAARGALSPTEGCALVRQIGEVLSVAHESGVLHHEVRPENVLVVRDAWGVERVKLTHWESATVTDTRPEAAVDLAGLGACAFLAFVGRARDDGEDVAQVEELAPDLKGVIAGAIGGANAKRFSSAKDFIDALESAAPRRRDSIQLLHSTPERRGKSMNPAPCPAKGEGGMPEEQRRFRRAAYRTPVRVEVPGVGSIDGRSEDISQGGLFVITRFRIAEGLQVTVRFALPIDGKVVSEVGVVRWSRGSTSAEGGEPRAFGIELASPSAEAVRQIVRYVSFMAVEPPPGDPPTP